MNAFPPDSNTRPYLRNDVLNEFGVELVIGFEPMSTDWQSAILAAGRNPHKHWSGRRESNSLAILEGWNSTNELLPLELSI